jgi:peptidoglycan/xylan/chitin deacetylase (PgdA/CDA1 family)
MIETIVGVAVATVGAIAHGAFYRNSPIFGRVITRLPTGVFNINKVQTPVLSLTFDDGPNPEATPRILDALAEHRVHATFFFLGRHVERWPALVARAAAEGHQIGNHGYYHQKLHFKSPAYVRDDIKLGTQAIEEAAGVSPKYFRAPHGFRSPWVTSIANSLGQQTVGWSLGVWDSDRPGVNEIVRRTVTGARSGSILLLHDGDGYNPFGDRLQTAHAIPHIIEQLKQLGYSFNTLPA